MAGTPRFKVYDSHGKYQAACKEPEAAACLMGLYGNGATIRDGHRAVWHEGNETIPAGESYDIAAKTILKRCWEVGLLSHGSIGRRGRAHTRKLAASGD